MFKKEYQVAFVYKKMWGKRMKLQIDAKNNTHALYILNVSTKVFYSRYFTQIE